MKPLETGFDAKVLVELSPFSVDFSRTTTTLKQTKSGSTYEKKRVVVSKDGFNNDFEVEITYSEYQTLRILNLRSIKSFAATLVPSKKEGGYPTLVLSGAT